MKNLVYFITVFLCFGCQSIERYNAHISTEIPVKKLKKDIDFVQRKIKKNHVKYDWYISKEVVDFKFDSLKNAINHPLKPNDFYLKIQPVIRSIRHGHTDIIPIFRKSTKSEQARLKDSKGPFNQLPTFWQNDTLYFTGNNFTKNKIKPGAVILQIDSIKPAELVKKYQATFYGDGFNQTYFQNRLNRNFFTYFYSLENGTKDSIEVTFLQDSILYKQKLYRQFPKVKKEEEKREKDTVKVVVKKALTEKEKLKQFEFSYNKSGQYFARTLSFPTNDSTFAVLKISTFSYGKYDDDYEEIFQIIKDYKVQNLVLDLRNNGGGRLAESYQLFSYLEPNKSHFLGEQLVANSSAFQRAVVNVFPKIIQPIFYPFSQITHFLTKKNSENKTYIKPALSRVKTINPNNSYSGNLYVIVNGGSYSASALISSNLQGLNRAYFVGEETGGDANGSVAGLMPNYKLPNTQLKLQIGTVLLSPYYFKTENLGHGVYPNQEIRPNLSDKINKKDPELHWIINDIKNDNQALKSLYK